MKARGVFITFEGAEGSGKTTQAAALARFLRREGWPVLLLREPGGVPISEAIRGILLDVRHTRMCRECETLLYMAARAQLVVEKILPALEAGRVVLCDRFLDSTLVYQGDGFGVAKAEIRRIGRFATRGIAPDLTFLFDIDAAEGLRRTGRDKDRIELRGLEYHERVRRGYLALARRERGRICVLAADRDRGEVAADVRRKVLPLLEARRKEVRR